MDLSKLSDADLQALHGGDMSKLSDAGLQYLHQANSPAPSGPAMSRSEKILKGMIDPIEGGAQLLTKALPQGVVDAGNQFNNWLADKTGLVARVPEGGVDQMVREGEAAYQAKRTAAGESGFDAYRAVGNVASPANLVVAARLPQGVSLAGRMAAGGAGGAGVSLLNPVTSGDDYWVSKAKQAGMGAAFGGVAPAVVGGIARVVNPNAANNANLAALKAEGVNPTVGQSLGGRWNAAEEKLQSVPIVGDMIAKARGRALDEFNTAAINRATAPIGVKIEGTGQKAVAEAGDAISDAYSKALDKLPALRLDRDFAQGFQSLYQGTRNLPPAMRETFDNIVQNVVKQNISPANAMLGSTYKQVDSELGNLATRYRSAQGSESLLGDALKELQSQLRQNVARNSPEAAKGLKAADEAWANLVRVEGAAKAGKNAEGVFTPAQLNSAVQTADKSTRKRAVARGEALMQDLSNAGQSVLGNKVPNSFTADRMMLSGGGLMAALYGSPAAAAGLLGGAALYTRPAQNALAALVSSRPDMAPAVANELRRLAPAFGAGGAQVGLSALE